MVADVSPLVATELEKLQSWSADDRAALIDGLQSQTLKRKLTPEEAAKQNEFLKRSFGSWVGNETAEEIMAMIKAPPTERHEIESFD